MKPIAPARPVAPTRLAPSRPLKATRLPIDIAAPDPLENMEVTGDPEVDSATELTEVQAGFRARAKAEAERFKPTTATDFYTCLVFQSGEQVDAFVAALGIGGQGDMFLDGVQLAAQLGIALPAATVPNRIGPKPDTKLLRLTGIPKRA